MMSRRAFILVIVLFLVGHPLLMTAAAEPIVIDRFSGDIDRATLMFSKSLVNSTLELEMPPGATIVSAEVTMEGLGGAAAESSILNFTNGKLDSNVFAVWTEARDLYPPKVDPRNNQWSKVSNREIPLIQKNDMNYWQIDTNDPKAGEPPGARAYQLYRFIPSTTGADNVTVRWEGFSTCGMNRTNPYHSEMWLYNHTDSDWIMVDFYDSQSMNDQWINYTFDLPSPFVDGDGSIDVLIVGINSQWAGPMLPAYDEGHLYTDYIELEVMSPGGLQYPSDVSMYIDLTEVTSLTGELRTTVTIDDSFGFPGALQAALDEHPVTPDNVTLSVSFAVGSPTAGRLLVSGLRIEYDPVVNNAPVYAGPGTLTVDEDSGRQVVLDLDTSFDDDFNKGELVFDVVDVDDSQYPGAIVAEVATAPGGNASLYITPDLDFFGGPINVTLSATDTFGAQVTAVVSVSVEQVGDRPVLESGGTFHAFERATFIHVFNVTDVDLPDDQFTFSDSSDLFDVDPDTGELNWTPSSNQIGEHRFGVTVTDRFGLTDSQLFTIDVKNSNDPPVITSELTLDAVEDQEAVYVIRAVDPDVPFGDVLSYFAFADDVEIDVEATTGQISFTPTNDQVPSFEIILRVQDTIGTTDEQVLAVTVENANDPPVFAEVTELSYDQGQSVVYQLLVTDPDMDVQLPVPETLTFSGTGPEFLRPDSSGLISFVADQGMVGEHDATYTVRDSAGLQDVVTITWTILDVNDAPDITSQLPDEIPEDSPFSFIMTATDPDGDAVTWSDDTDLFDIDPNTGAFEFTPTQAEVGNLLITLTADDGREGVAMVTWDFMVENVNDAPVIGTVSPSSGGEFGEDEAIPFSAQATDEDGDSLTYTWMRGKKVLGAGASVDVKDLGPGKHTVTLVVTDGKGGEATHDIKVEVTASGMSVSTLGIAVIVVVLVALVGAVLYMRSRSAAEPVEEPAPEEEEEIVEKVTFKESSVLEYETHGLAKRADGTTETVEEPIYELEEASEFRVDEGSED